MTTSHHCYRCNEIQELSSNSAVGRRDTCTCGADLHVCRNCEYYDPKMYNGCREPKAERVVDKEKSNYCDQFRFRIGGSETKGDVAKAAKAKLDDLFK